MTTNFLLTSFLVFFITINSSSCLKPTAKDAQIPAGKVADINQIVAENTVQLPNETPENQSPKIPVQRYKIINIYPHDPKAFTQGLVYHQGVLYEGTGLEGQSSLRKVELETGKVLQIHRLAAQYFGEGIAIWQDKIIQLTWTSQVGLVYDLATFEQVGEFNYPTEGWGITHDGEKLIMSDGTDTLYFLAPDTFEKIGQVKVKYGNQPVHRLNELEYINGEVFANVWMTDFIVRIAPKTGQIVGVIDLSGLHHASGQKMQGNDVLNGIAYDPEADRLFVTGKLWPNLYEIELVPKGP